MFNATNDCPIYVLASAVEAYKIAPNMSSYESRVQPLTGITMNGVRYTWQTDETWAVAEIIASGDIVIPETIIGCPVTSIGTAFQNHSDLTSVTIGNSVTSIGWSAFSGCSGLTEVTIPNSVTSIGEKAFKDCSGLTEVTIPNSVTSINWSAFSGCSGLTKITLPYVGTYQYPFGYIFGTDSYTGGTSTKQYYHSSSTITETSSNYYIPTSLKEVVITAAYNIPHGAFYNCSGLTSVTIPESATSIGQYAFYNCSSLTEVTIPESVTSIGEDMMSEEAKMDLGFL